MKIQTLDGNSGKDGTLFHLKSSDFVLYVLPNGKTLIYHIPKKEENSIWLL